MSPLRYLLPAAAAALLLTLAGCRTASEESAEPVAHRVENTEMGVAIAALPDIFRVTVTESSRMELELIEGQGHLEIVADEPESSINLVAAVKDHQAAIVAKPGGKYNGGQEMVVPALPGAAFYSRGSYEGDQGRIEETTVFLIHPWRDRKLRVVYTYPAGEDSKERLENQLFLVVEALEGLPEPGAEAPDQEVA